MNSVNWPNKKIPKYGYCVANLFVQYLRIISKLLFPRHLKPIHSLLLIAYNLKR